MSKIGDYFKDIGNIKTISLGLVYVFLNLYFIFHIPQFFSPETQAFWFKVFISYAILNTMIFTIPSVRNKLFNVNFWSAIPRFLVFFGVFLFIFAFILKYVDPLGASGFGLLKILPYSLLLVHGLTFAITETAVFQGFLDDELGMFWSNALAGFFHFGIWTGSVVWVTLGAGLLFAMFSLINLAFRQNRDDLIPAIASHTAFNYVQLGLLIAAGGVALV